MISILLRPTHLHSLCCCCLSFMSNEGNETLEISFKEIISPLLFLWASKTVWLLLLNEEQKLHDPIPQLGIVVTNHHLLTAFQGYWWREATKVIYETYLRRSFHAGSHCQRMNPRFTVWQQGAKRKAGWCNKDKIDMLTLRKAAEGCRLTQHIRLLL